MIFFFGCITNFAMILLLKVTDKTGGHSYEAIVEKVLGKAGSFYLAICMMITLIIGNAGHISTVGQVFHDIDL